jgi:transposase-like protein
MSFGRQQTWTSQELETIRVLSHARRSSWDIATHLNRSLKSVQAKINRLGLARYRTSYCELPEHLLTFTCQDCGSKHTRKRRLTKSGAIYGRARTPLRCYPCKKKRDWAIQREKRGLQPKASVWTDELKAQVKALWLDGKSASEVAQALGLKTRNQIIGFVHREGLGRPRKASSDQRKAIRRKQSRNADAPAIKPLGLPVEPPPLFARHECIPFMERKQSQCSQILYDKPTLCCPQPAVYRGVCAHHAQVNYKFRNA